MTESELDLEAIEERCNEATPGPWTVNEDGGLMASKGYELIGSDGDAVWMMSHDDAVFIAHAREDIPALIREIRRLRDAVKAFYTGLIGVIETYITVTGDAPSQNIIIKKGITSVAEYTREYNREILKVLEGLIPDHDLAEWIKKAKEADQDGR